MSLRLPGCSAGARNKDIIASVATSSGGGTSHAVDLLRHAGFRFKSVLIAAISRTPPLMLPKEEAFALFSCTFLHRHPVGSSVTFDDCCQERISISPDGHIYSQYMGQYGPR